MNSSSLPRRLFGVAAAGTALWGMTRLLRARQRRGIRVFRLQHIDAPRGKVFRFWSDFADFPRFLSHIRRVEVLDETHSRWVVDGALGKNVVWEAEVTHRVPDEVISWETTSGGVARHRGTVRFYPDGFSGTRVVLDMVYFPPGGALGHRLAEYLRVDPRARVDEDLGRIKTFLETGRVDEKVASPQPPADPLLTDLRTKGF